MLQGYKCEVSDWVQNKFSSWYVCHSYIIFMLVITVKFVRSNVFFLFKLIFLILLVYMRKVDFDIHSNFLPSFPGAGLGLSKQHH